MTTPRSRKLALAIGTAGVIALAACSTNTGQPGAQASIEAEAKQIAAVSKELTALGKQYASIPQLSSAAPAAVAANAERRVALLAKMSTTVNELDRELTAVTDPQILTAVPAMFNLPRAWGIWLRAESGTWNAILSCTKRDSKYLYAKCMKGILDDKDREFKDQMARRQLEIAIGDANGELQDLRQQNPQ